MKKKTKMILAALFCLLLILATACGTKAPVADTAAAADEEIKLLDENTTYEAVIEVENYGNIVFTLRQDAAPVSAANFVSLAKDPAYADFHSIEIAGGKPVAGASNTVVALDGDTLDIKTTVEESCQFDGYTATGVEPRWESGDPNGNGSGGSGKSITGEFKSNGHDNPISHVRGVVSMARAQDPNSGSSQFFIVQTDSTYLDGDYAAFGEVTEGMDVVDQICSQVPVQDKNGTVAAADQPVITSVTIREK